jgi:hypothetical protein
MAGDKTVVIVVTRPDGKAIVELQNISGIEFLDRLRARACRVEASSHKCKAEQ